VHARRRFGDGSTVYRFGVVGSSLFCFTSKANDQTNLTTPGDKERQKHPTVFAIRSKTSKKPSLARSSCRVEAAGYPAAPPTDPDVNNSLIRFLGSTPSYPSRFPNRRLPVWRITGLPVHLGLDPRGQASATGWSEALVPSVGVLLRWFVVSKYLPSFPPTERYARLPLPYSGSLGPRFPALPDEHCSSLGTMVRYDGLCPFSTRFASRSLADTLLASFALCPGR